MTTTTTTAPPVSRDDPNSFANTHEVVVRHTHLSVSVDFANRTVSGAVEHTVEAVGDGGARALVLDSSGVRIAGAQLPATGESLDVVVAAPHAVYGAAVTVRFPAPLRLGERCVVRIEFATTDKCTALQWLEPSQTVGKRHPYMFSQCQAIHARSLVPCQDTPSVKHTYSADITVPEHLRALMSAVPTGETAVAPGLKQYHFHQKIDIPSYLIAIAVGNIEGRRVGPRSTVWSEPEVVDAAAWEFADTESFIKTGEDILTPYVWGVYDLLVLPASFPYGGMENPCLTFVTPTLLAGDRSLVDVVAHEIAHSWTGNLVTAANWEHFWLNEGFTVFVERKIASRLFGEPMRHFDAIIGLKALQESVDHFKETGNLEYSCMCCKLGNKDPDDAFSSVPYEKGFNFLFYLENLVGGAAVFDPFLKAYVEAFSHKSITTDDFKQFVLDYFGKVDGGSKLAVVKSVDWDTWLYKSGMPAVANVFDNSLAAACEKLANQWDAARTNPDPAAFDKKIFDTMTSNQKVMFLEKMMQKPVFATATLDTMDNLYGLTAIANAEVRMRWLSLCLAAAHERLFPHVTAFLGEVGRMKYVRPLYRALNKCGESGRALAVATFTANRSFYHPICSTMVAKDLGL